MADSSLGRAAFLSQADALLRKNLTYQKRNLKSLIRLFFFPILFFILLGWAQKKVGEFTKEISIPEIRDPPPAGPSMLQVPSPAFRAVKTGFFPYQDLPDPSCRKDGSCPASILFTGSNKSLSTSVADKLIPSPSLVDPVDAYSLLVDHAWGSDGFPMEVDGMGYFSGGGFEPLYDTVYQVQPSKKLDTVSTQRAAELLQLDVKPVEALPLWRDSSSQISDELYRGYSKGNAEGNISEIMIAYDLLTTNGNNFNVNVWYNSTFDSPITAASKDMLSATMNPALRVPRTVNLVTNAYIKLLLGDGAGIPFDYVKSMPMPASKASFDVLQIVGPVLFLYMILLLFPVKGFMVGDLVILTSLVYEKQEKLRIIMKMHGLTDGTYWTVTYAYNFVICFIYVVIFCNMGELFGFRMFTLNSYGMQYLFFFIYINLQIAMAFLLGSVFSNVKTASVVGYIMVFGSGLVTLIFTKLLDSPSFPSYLLTILELYPGLGLARGLYELLKSGDEAFYTSTVMSIKDMSDGMKEVLIIMVVEWFVFLFAAYYLDQALAAGGGVRKNPFSNIFKKKPQKPIRMSSIQSPGSNVAIQMEKDVAQERQKVEQLLSQPDPDYLIVCDDIKKMYPARDGNPPKYAVKGLSLALPRGECFGMLGPNGAGKSSFISMMIGLTEPSSGTAYIQGLDIRTDMDEVYTSMGVCPQHDLLWETLTGREHLLFYGRLKQLSGSALHQAVEESLDAVNLLGVADKQAGRYSGGMKRRLSVAISLIGDPKVVYMDEPSTGLDPASRNLLWNVVKNAKRNRAIILTTHSMEEAEYLCDRLGIFVSGSLQCVGTTSELKGRYGGSFILTVTTSPNHDGDVETLARRLSPGAARVYHIPGTQKFELPKYDVKISDVFQAVDDAKKRFPIQAWGLADTTLEDVFIKVACEAQSVKSLS